MGTEVMDLAVMEAMEGMVIDPPLQLCIHFIDLDTIDISFICKINIICEINQF